MAFIPACLNTVWMLSCTREAWAFQRATCDVQRTQERILRKILRNNQDTWYGRQQQFASIRSTREFQDRVPLAGYDQLREPVDRIAAGESAVLTQDAVTLLEPTGGSSQAEKLIPYNATLHREFQRAIAPWVFDVMRGLPKIRKGRAYWSISPMAQEPRTSSGGIPIGFEDDREYLSVWQRRAVSRLMIIPAAVRQLRSIENARYVTALHLLASKDLSLISVWSPTFLTALTAGLPDWIESICTDLRRGQIRLPQPQLEPHSAALTIRRDQNRAEQVQAAFSNSSSLTEILADCWPQLAMISCWGDASSSIYLSALRAQFPHVPLQPKGLLATEGVVSIPLLETSGSVLAVRSHFLEFRELSATGSAETKMRLAHELVPGNRYRVYLTTGGGLYRYDLGDEVEVVDYYNQCPCIRLLGRGEEVSDLVGEKLHEQFVRSTLAEVTDHFGLKVQFAMVAPVASSTPHYRLYIEMDTNQGTPNLNELRDRLEHSLRENPHYRIAIEAEQLRPIEVQPLRGDGWRIYEEACTQRGQKVGDIKPRALDHWTGWEQAFSNAS